MNAFIDINCDDDAIPRVLLRDASHDPERAAWVFDHVSRPVLDEFLPLIERATAGGAVTAPIPALFFLNFAYGLAGHVIRSEEHTSELQSLMRNSYAVFCLHKK